MAEGPRGDSDPKDGLRLAEGNEGKGHSDPKAGLRLAEGSEGQGRIDPKDGLRLAGGYGQSGPKIPRHAGTKRGPRESRPEFGKPGGIYGPGGSRLPAHVLYRAGKQRYQARVRRVDGKRHRNLADAVAEASALRGVPA